MFLSNRNSAYA